MTRTSPTSGTAETAAPSKREGRCTSVWSPRATMGQVAIAAINAAAISPDTARARAAGAKETRPPGATGASARATCSRNACTSVGEAAPRTSVAGASGELDRGQQIAGHRRQQRAGAASGGAIVVQRARRDEDTPRQHHQAERAGEAGGHRGPEVRGTDGRRRQPEREEANAQRRRAVARRLEAGAQQEPPPHRREEALNSVPLAHRCAESYQLRGGAARAGRFDA